MYAFLYSLRTYFDQFIAIAQDVYIHCNILYIFQYNYLNDVIILLYYIHKQ